MSSKNSDKESSPPNGDSSSDSPVSDDSNSPPSDDSSSSPPPPSSPPPSPPKDSSPPPPNNKDSPSSDNSKKNDSPSPPSGNDNKSPPPSSPPPSSPPPPSGNDDKSSPPPPSDNNDKKSPPPSNNNNNSQPPPSSNNNPPPNSNNNKDNNNNNHNQTPPSPQSNNQKKSPATPESQDSSSTGADSQATLHSPLTPFTPSGALAPPKAKSPPTHKTSAKEESNQPDEKLIIGVAAGIGLLLLVMIVLVVSCLRRKKRKPHNQMHYYNDGSQGNRPSDYYNTNGGPWRHNGPPSDHVVKMPHSGAVSSEHGWPPGPPPPPPPMMSSSELSSAAFSGPYQAPPPPPPAMALGMNQSNFTYDDLAAATGGFAQTNLLGQGGFGYVHKGVLPNGKEIAVKSLKSNSGQGEREFQAEVDIISRVHHRHLVSLVGYCIAGNQRMLVYEFVPNNTLEFHLHGAGRPIMDWPTRLIIALGSAKGFAYLHEDCHPRIIHRDIKAANILLDENMEAKVADFGLAKLSSDTNTHVSTRIMGTFGYLAPEYASSGKLTEKSDVYSYGVMLLELITGRRPIDMSRDDDDSLIDWARPVLTRVMDGGSYEELVDPRLEGNYEPQEMLRMVACAAACIRHSARRRPKMSQIVRALEGDVSLEDLNDGGVKPGHSSVFGSSGSSEYDANSYNTDMKKFRKTGLSSQEFSSSEHGTGEFVRSGDSQEMRPNGMRGMRNNP